MANSTVLSLVQSFCREYGLPVVGGLAGSSDGGALQLRELLQAVGDDCWDAADWQECSRYFTWTSILGTDQGDITTLFTENFAKMIPNTFWDMTTRLQFEGPLTPGAWSYLLAMGGPNPRPAYRISNNRIELSASIAAGHTLSAQYKSRNWVLNTGGARETWLTDADTSIFPDIVMKAGLRAFWLRAKQMPHRLEMEMYEDKKSSAAAKSGVNNVLQMDGTDSRFAAGIVIPIGNWTVP